MKKHITSAPVVYLIHFTRKLGNPSSTRGMAQHYVGSAQDLAARLERHRVGNGSAIMAAVAKAGIPWVLARTWEDGTSEQAIKRLHNAPKLCPICRGEITIETRRPGRRPMVQRPVSFYQRGC